MPISARRLNLPGGPRQAIAGGFPLVSYHLPISLSISTAPIPIPEHSTKHLDFGLGEVVFVGCLSHATGYRCFL